jgi:hypothetical protein
MPSRALTHPPPRDATQPLQLIPSSPSARLRQHAAAGLNSFVTSARFKRMCDDTFDACDIDKSGTIEAAELFAAILLLNHSLNMLPLGKRQQPPSREQVLRILRAHARDGADGDALSRADFTAVCQDVCRCVACGFLCVRLCTALPCGPCGLRSY